MLTTLLRSLKETQGYTLRATDGEIGQVQDFIINDADWAIHYIVVDTKNGHPNGKVLISPWWVDDIDREKHKMHIHISKEQVKNSPPYDFSSPVSREYEDK